MPTSKDDPKSIATAFLQAWTRGDFDSARALLDEQATFDGPLGHTEGADAYIKGVRGFAKIIRSIEIHQVVAEGDDVCVMYDILTNGTAGSLSTAGWYRVRNGKVLSVRAFFDPRPLLT